MIKQGWPIYDNVAKVIVTAKSVNEIEYVEYDKFDSKMTTSTYTWTQGYGIFDDNANPKEKGNGKGYLDLDYGYEFHFRMKNDKLHAVVNKDPTVTDGSLDWDNATEINEIIKPTTQDTPAPAGRGQVNVLRRGEGRRAAGRGQVNVLRRGEGRRGRQ